ncbi:MAG: SIMPL domain-containing protein [Anaerolineales bacterium]
MNSHNRIQAIILVGIAALGLLTACAAPAASASSPRTSEDAARPKTISVTGNGIAYGQPDVATLQIGVNTRDGDVGKAVSANTDRVNSLTQVLKSLGIEEKDLQTSNFSVNAQQDYGPDGQPKGTITYYVDNTLTVTVRDLGKLSNVLGEAVAAGANSIYGIGFGVADTSALEADARTKAVADAKARAEQLAQAAGVKIVGIVSISEGYYSPIVPLPYAAEARVAQGGGAPVPVSTGQLQVNLQVNVTYEIE